MKRFSPWCYVASLLFLSGCGGATSPKAVTAAEGSQSSSSENDGVAARPVLSRVAAPADLVGLLRLKSLGSAADTLSSWVSLPFEWRTQLRELVGDVEPAVSFDTPLEAALVLDAKTGKPRALYAFSIGLSSLDGALSLLQARGLFVERAGSGGYSVRFDDDLHCVADHALGAAPARLVCSENERSLSELGPYMFRGLPGEALSESQLYAEFRSAPIRARYGKNVQFVKLGVPLLLREVSLDNPTFDGALSDAAYAIADEVVSLAEDLDALVLEGAINAKQESLDGSLAVRLRGQSSWLAKTLAASVQRSAPELFWSLPRDVNFAQYAISTASPSSQAIAETTSRLLSGFLEQVGVPGKLRDSLASAVKASASQNATVVIASGPRSASALSGPGTAGAIAARTTKAPKVAALRAGAGYLLEGIEADGGRTLELLKQLHAVYNHPAFSKGLKGKKLGKLAALSDGRELPSLKLSRPAALAGLPEGTQGYQLNLGSKLVAELFDIGENESEPLDVYLVAVPGTERTWLAVGTEPQLLADKLKLVLDGKPEQTLVERPGLTVLKTQPALMGAFFSLRALLDPLLSGELAQSADADAFKRVSQSVALLRHRGESPIVQRFTVGKEGKEWNLAITVPRPAVEDIVSLIMALATSGAEPATPPATP